MQTRLFDYWRSSASYRVRIALNLKGIEHSRIPVDLLAGEHRLPEHLARNPQGLVPALEIDGMMMTQSVAIIEYLDETRSGHRLLPGDAAARQWNRTLAYAIAMDVHPLVNMTMARHGASLSEEPDALKHWMQRFMAPGLEAFEALLASRAPQRFCTGDTVTLADICLLPQVYNARRWGLPLDGMQRIVDICDALETVPQVAAAHPDLCKPD